MISTVAGTGVCDFSGDGGPARKATLCQPIAVAADAPGNLYIGDAGNARVRKVNKSGIIQTIAGTGSIQGYNGDGLPAKKTNLDYPVSVAVSPVGVVNVADDVQSRVRKIE
jgi:hypothetical protein